MSAGILPALTTAGILPATPAFCRQPLHSAGSCFYDRALVVINIQAGKEEVQMYSRTRGYLPHTILPESIYFVTFRLADSLPASVLIQYKEEAQFGLLANSLKKVNHRYQEAVQKYLDNSYGSCWLRKPEIASMVNTAIRYFNHQRYELFVWTIMPNHVHVLLKLLGDAALSSIIHSWKSFTAREANRKLARTGEFWQREYFDVLVKSERQLEFFLRYILNNPVKAGLCSEIFHWPWTGCSDEMQAVARKFFL